MDPELERTTGMVRERELDDPMDDENMDEPLDQFNLFPNNFERRETNIAKKLRRRIVKYRKAIMTEAQVDVSGMIHRRDDELLQVVLASLRSSTTIRSLRLSRCRLLHPALPQDPPPVDNHNDNNNNNDENNNDFTNVTVDARHQQEHDDAVAALTDAIAQNATLEILILQKTDMGDPGACALAQNLCAPSCTLTWLNLEDCHPRIGYQGVAALAGALGTTNTSLQVLSLAFNGLQDDSAITLADLALRQNTCPLQVLILRGNQINAPGAQALLDALKQDNAMLQTLDLEGNHEASIRPMRPMMTHLLRRNTLLQQAKDFLRTAAHHSSCEEILDRLAKFSADQKEYRQHDYDNDRNNNNNNDHGGQQQQHQDELSLEQQDENVNFSAVFTVVMGALAPHLATTHSSRNDNIMV